MLARGGKAKCTYHEPFPQSPSLKAAGPGVLFLTGTATRGLCDAKHRTGNGLFWIEERRLVQQRTAPETGH